MKGGQMADCFHTRVQIQLKQARALTHLFGLLTATLGFVLSVPLSAQALPDEIAQTGIVTNAAGVPINGEHTLRVRIYNAPRGGQRMFEEEHRNIEIIEGRYSIAIGSQDALPADLFEEEQLFFTIALDDGEEMGPRLPIMKVPAAMVADIAMDVRGEIRPESIRIGRQVVINSEGEWVGSPTGLQGPAGPPGEVGPADPLALRVLLGLKALRVPGTIG